MHDLSEPIIIRPKIKEISYPFAKTKKSKDNRSPNRQKTRGKKLSPSQQYYSVSPISRSVPFRFTKEQVAR